MEPRNCDGRIFDFYLMELHKPKQKNLQNVTRGSWKLNIELEKTNHKQAWCIIAQVI